MGFIDILTKEQRIPFQQSNVAASPGMPVSQGSYLFQPPLKQRMAAGAPRGGTG